MSGKKVAGKIVDGLVKGATILGGGAAVEQSVRGRRENSDKNDKGDKKDKGAKNEGNSSKSGGNSQGK